MTYAELITRYPLLYHMAWEGSWPSIAKHGLLSSERLLDKFKVGEPRRSALLSSRRAESQTISHPMLGTAVLRDQKPLNDAKLLRSLTGGLSLPDWYRMLNQRVFFWLTEDRLLRLMSAEAYRDASHDVLVVRTADLLNIEAATVELTAMNTGATRPMAFPRGRETFKQVEEFPYADRCARRLEPVIELTVLGGVVGINRCVERVERWSRCKPTKVLHRQNG